MNKEVKQAHEIVPDEVLAAFCEETHCDGKRFTHVILRHDGCLGIGMSECSPSDEWDIQEGYDLAWDRAFVSFARDYAAKKRAKSTLYERVAGYIKTLTRAFAGQ